MHAIVVEAQQNIYMLFMC